MLAAFDVGKGELKLLVARGDGEIEIGGVDGPVDLDVGEGDLLGVVAGGVNSMRTGSPVRGSAQTVMVMLSWVATNPRRVLPSNRRSPSSLSAVPLSFFMAWIALTRSAWLGFRWLGKGLRLWMTMACLPLWSRRMPRSRAGRRPWWRRQESPCGGGRLRGRRTWPGLSFRSDLGGRGRGR